MTTQPTIYRASDRGHADHGWLKANHSFSFGSWYNPDRMNFGALRVLNDDIVAPGMGFPTHPHDNMEIITIPLSGAVHHQDSMGNKGEIPAGEVQVMSAGTGVTHSEFNGNQDAELKIFQIWIIPNQRNVEPRYDQIKIDPLSHKNKFTQLVSPNKDDEGTWIHQDAYIHMASLEAGKSIDYIPKNSNNGIYVMIIDGSLSILSNELNDRDAMSIVDAEKLTFDATKNSQFIVLEVPMTF
ncbi:MAG: pirin family protein [Crocinitomicaceae bacterium]|nr:pirin family protein [Flavobacteriales bacterium]NQZ37904.1 pirin family protein [Crocinitomicaceae bacterium]